MISNEANGVMDTVIFENLRNKLSKEKILCALVMRNDRLVFKYFKRSKGENSLYHINSVTKSFTSALIGICLQKGLIKDINAPIMEYFSDELNRQEDERKKQITIYHLLTMTPGFDWPEFGKWAYFSPMEYSKNIIRFIFDRDMECSPGERMNYNSGCSHLLSAIIQKTSGMTAEKFAEENLFSPLGIKDYNWLIKQNVSLGANGLSMRAEDMLKFGSLYLNKGKYKGIEIIPESWINESTNPRFHTYENIGYYGYQWWVSDFEGAEGKKIGFYFALGLFGQFIIVVPDCDMVVVFISENYSETMKPMYFFREYICKLIEGFN